VQQSTPQPSSDARDGGGLIAVGWFEAVVLGLVQGLTEFIPVSSSAHLRVVGEAFGWDDPGAAFTAIIQIGTELAVLLYFRRDIGRIVRAWVLSLFREKLRGDPDARMGWLIIVGSIPIIVLGLLFQDSIETTLRDLRIVAIALVAFSLILYWADRVGSKQRELSDLTVRSGIAFGLAQAMALVPGVSRSGGTITAGLFLGFSRAAAARYSFLLAIPAVLGSGVFQAYEALGDDTEGEPISWGPTLLATVIAFAVGFLVIAWLLRYLDRGSFTPFVVYRVVLGLALLALVGAGVLDPLPPDATP
jgi:undecaprenyl-diphosphatase